MKKPAGQTITGIVDLWGTGGSQWADTRKWEFSFNFSHWRINEGPVQSGKLAVSQVVSQAQLDRLMDETDALAIIRVSAVSVEDGKAEMKSLLETGVRDRELEAVVKEIKKPVTVKHPFFGRLTLDKKTLCLEVQYRFHKTRITLCIEADEEGSHQENLAAAEALCREAEYWETQARARAVQDLLALKNDNWLEEDEEELDEAAFKKRIKPEQLTVLPDGRFALEFDDGDLFWGHSITVSGIPGEGCLKAEI